MPPVSANGSSGYWRSMEELGDTPEFRRFVESEFPSRAGELVDPLSRRRFLQVMGASLALAGVGCDALRWPKENILEFAARPANRDPGTTVSYATSIDFCGVGTGLLVTSYDGRPIKIEGNPQHPESLGATDGFMQAAVLDLYDPDRSTQVLKDGPFTDPTSSASSIGDKPVIADEKRSTWAAFEEFAKGRFNELRGGQGAKLAILSEASSSASLARLRRKLEASLPKALWCEWEPLSFDAARAGAALAFGKPVRQQLSLARARAVVALDADLLGQWPASLRLRAEWGARRRVEESKDLLRLYVAEAGLTITGGVADARLGVAPSQVEAVGLKLAAELVGKAGVAASDEVKAALAKFAAKDGDPHQQFVAHAAKDLAAAGKAGALVVGPSQPARVHALAHLVNSLLGAHGTTVGFTDDPAPARPGHDDALKALVAAMNAGQVDTLLVLGSNPVLAAPADLGFGDAFGKVAHRIHLGQHVDETARLCTWHLPQAHWLEAWGDARAWDGTVSPIQPLIAPLYGGRTALEVVALCLGESKKMSKGYEIVRRTFEELTGQKAGEPAFEKAWRRALHDGVLPGTAAATVEVSAKGALAALPAGLPAGAAEGQLELAFTPDSHTWDGRFANNAWLQELPDPLTKLTWDNAALVSPATAKAQGVKSDDLVTLTVEGRPPLEVPVLVLPGQPDGVVSLSVGYGRGRAAGVVAAGTGFDAYPLRTTGAPWAARCTLAGTGKRYELATTQDHNAIDTHVGREETEDRVFGGGREDDTSWTKHLAAPLAPLFREASVKEFEKDPTFAKVIIGPDPATTQLWDAPRPWGEGHQWGMTIDLSACTGCSACVVACQAENNIPVVGKSEVARGREMHWLRIDRYFKGDPMGDHEAAQGSEWKPRPLQVAFQPVPCMQCENAPCEAVCPVGATTHSRDGLNDMAYNRCIGTRYCANNCPYKVRRFNWFWNHHGPFHPRTNPIKVDGKVVSQLPKVPLLTDQLAPVEQMAMNPDVTVRSRGVMEKCTYCVQRLRQVSIKARNEGRRVRDGEVTTACAQACATRAIVFGDLNDPESAVSKSQALDRAYGMLAELNTRPRTQFLARISNPPVEAHS